MVWLLLGVPFASTKETSPVSTPTETFSRCTGDAVNKAFKPFN